VEKIERERIKEIEYDVVRFCANNVSKLNAEGRVWAFNTGEKDVHS
jgi:hypothetical protein